MSAPVVVRVRPFGTDKYGDPMPGVANRLTIVGAFTAPRESGDLGDRGRQGVLVGLTLFAPYHADILSTDQVEVDGDLFDIDGDVGRWRNPFSAWEAGMTVALKRAEG